MALLVALVRQGQSGASHKVGPDGRLTLETPIGVAKFVKLIPVIGQALDRDPIMPVGQKAPGLVAHIGMRKPVVKSGTGADLLVGQASPHARFVEKEKKRQKIEIALARRIGGQIVVRQALQIRPIIRRQYPAHVSLRVALAQAGEPFMGGRGNA